MVRKPVWVPIGPDEVDWAGHFIMDVLTNREATSEDKLLAGLFVRDLVKLVKQQVSP